jgi:hypothetical protein
MSLKTEDMSALTLLALETPVSLAPNLAYVPIALPAWETLS